MLQQTQVDTVLNRYYHPFLKHFPTLTVLKNAPAESVMHAWQGLGYYRRAGFLHETAKRSAPKLPTDIIALMALPGIGRNTAHALLAFAYHQPFAVMEANVKRIISRIFALEIPTENQLWQAAESLLNRAEPFNHNQAMMDLGTMICTPAQPKCELCPANTLCKGKANPLRYPQKKAKKTAPIRKQQILMVQDSNGKIYARPREGKLLGGLYQFIELESDITTIKLNSNIAPKSSWKKLGNVQQKYSHFTLNAEIFMLNYHGAHAAKNWYSMSDLPKLPWSNAEKKILQLFPPPQGEG